MIEVNNITKKFGTIKALDNLSFTINKPEILGIIGPDGAGKTTLFKILASLLLPDTGSIKMPDSNIGYMPGKFSLYPDLTVEENLKFYASIYGKDLKKSLKIVEEIYKMLEPFKDRKAENLSGGMKQKLALCCALIPYPVLLLLDEPTTGIDPISRKELWEILNNLKLQGKIIIVSTPYMDEAAMCDELAFMQNGNFIIKDTPQNIIKKCNKNNLEDSFLSLI